MLIIERCVFGERRMHFSQSTTKILLKIIKTVIERRNDCALIKPGQDGNVAVESSDVAAIWKVRPLCARIIILQRFQSSNCTQFIYHFEKGMETELIREIMAN